MLLDVVRKNPEIYWSLLKKPVSTLSGCRIVTSNVPSSWLNGVVGGVADNIDEVAEHFYSQGIPFSWWHEGDVAPKNLSEALAHYNVHYQGEASGMELDLKKCPSKSNILHFTVERVLDEASLKEFIEVLIKAYEAPEGLFESVFTLFNQASFTLPACHFIGRYNEKAVSVGSFYIDEKSAVASLFNIATLEAHRCKGYASQLVLEGLEFAKLHGAQHAALAGLEHAVDMYKRLGFEKVCSFQLFM